MVIHLLFGLLSSFPLLATDLLKEELKKPSIHLIAPGSMIKPKVVEKFRAVLKEQGFETILPEEAINDYKGYANSDEKRFEFFIQAIEGKDPIIWALRGGFGSQDVLRELVQYAQAHKEPPFKLLCGFSDITHLGLGLYNLFGWSWLHCQVYYCQETFGVSGVDVHNKAPIKQVTSILEGTIKSVSYSLTPLNSLAKEKPIEKSSVLGGNLSIIQRNIEGLFKKLDWSNTILFLEDTPEESSRAKDILYGMFDTERFDKVAGIVFGDMPFSDCKTEDFITEFCKYLLSRKLEIPVYYYPRIGHGDYNDPLPMGTLAKIELREKAPVLTVAADFFK
jgi:muramoyltetrapeptide carboxypeptidase